MFLKKDIMFIIIKRDKTKHESFTREALLSSDGSTRADEAATQKTSSSPYACLRVPPDTRARMQICRSVEGAEPVRAQSIPGSPAESLGALSPICS